MIKALVGFITLLLFITAVVNLLLVSSMDVNKKTPNRSAEKIRQTHSLQQPSSIPVRIIIPSIHVDASIQAVSLTKTGAMSVPTNTREAGWYALGSKPGETGSAVIAGHYDTAKGTPGVFEKLHLLIQGDLIQIKDNRGKVTTFSVQKTHQYNPAQNTSEIFGQVSGKHLNLITCDGFWDTASQSYTKRLVVFADLRK